MDTEKKVIISGVIAAVVISLPFLYFLFFVNGHSAAEDPLWSVATSTEEAQKAYAYTPNPDSNLIRFTPGVEVWYTNTKLHFSFRVPDGFTAPDATLKGSSGQAVTLSNKADDTLLILALPITTGKDQQLTEEIVRANAVGQNISNIEETLLKEGTRGLMFQTDADDWNGAGRAFWFIHDGYLYQITTYEKDAELLDLVMQTLRFATPVPPAQTK